MKTRFLIPFWIFCILLLYPFTTFAEERELVLITSSKNDISPINHNDLRRVFLGLSTKNAESSLTPVGNRSDENMYEVFLQKVIHMSSRTYERHLLNKVFIRGNQRMKIANNKDDLLKALKYNENAITFIWANEIANNPNLKIVQSIWKGNVNP